MEDQLPALSGPQARSSTRWTPGLALLWVTVTRRYLAGVASKVSVRPFSWGLEVAQHLELAPVCLSYQIVGSVVVSGVQLGVLVDDDPCLIGRRCAGDRSVEGVAQRAATQAGRGQSDRQLGPLFKHVGCHCGPAPVAVHAQDQPAGPTSARAGGTRRAAVRCAGGTWR